MARTIQARSGGSSRTDAFACITATFWTFTDELVWAQRLSCCPDLRPLGGSNDQAPISPVKAHHRRHPCGHSFARVRLSWRRARSTDDGFDPLAGKRFNHRAAQSAGRKGVFRDYRLRVAAVVRYGMTRAATGRQSCRPRVFGLPVARRRVWQPTRCNPGVVISTHTGI
jgi:hypothetical protein